MRKYVILTVVFVLLISLFGCSAQQYKLICENGYYFAEVEKGIPVKGSDTVTDIGYTPRYPIYFQSISEMCDDIRKGNFTDGEYSALVDWADENGRVSLPNIDALLEPIYPTDVGNYKISMQRSDYKYIFSNHEVAEYLELSFSEDMSDWDHQLEKLMNFENSLVRGAEVYKIESEENGKTYYYITSQGTHYVAHIYTIEQSGTIYYVKEKYTLDGYSNGIPDYMDVYFANDDADFYSYLYIDTPKQRYNAEWITMFGWKEYVAE